MKKINVAIIGGGGREHAIALKLKESPLLDKLFCLPGNAGIAECATCAPVSPMDFEGIFDFCIKNGVDLVFVAPDDPLAGGLVDFLTERGVKAFGPVKKAAMLEASKAFAKEFMARHGIPTAAYRAFDDFEDAEEYAKNCDLPVVVKADGLALGKGVVICRTRQEVFDALKSVMVDLKFGENAGRKVVMEEFMTGREVTVLAFCDGKTLLPMPASQDHKKAFDGDKGANTGGMGAFAPTPYFLEQDKNEFLQNIALPTLKGLEKDGIVFKGVLYFGLMKTSGGLKVVEYNARFGDPETQVVLTLLKSDLLEIVNAVIEGRLDCTEVLWSDETALTVVVADGGYPDNVVKGKEIRIGDLDGVRLLHAGTKLDGGRLKTNGGRVFNVVGVDESLDKARKKVYGQIDKVGFEGARYRADIGLV
ncbi:phosphoribosylamine--glycine ligase [Subdoligranulum sp. CAG:314]|nr:phosphoribosylamine--glycine ligase [Subdoligranulum sp. CAG:314]